MAKKIFLLGILYSSQALSAHCKVGPEAYGASTGSKPIGGVLPSTCGGKPCEVNVEVNDMVAPGKDLLKIEESTRPDGTKETKLTFGTVDKEKEKESAKEASEKAQKEATEAKHEAEKQEKEAAEAQEKAEKAEKEAADIESAEKAAEAEKQAEEERLEAEEAKAEAETKAAEAEAAKKEADKEAENEKDNPPPEDDDGGLDEDDNIRPVNDGADPWADAEAKNEKAKKDYAAGKGPLDCSNPKVQCVNAEIELNGSENALKISVPITKGGVDCRYSRCLDEEENTNDSAANLLGKVDDICTYSECMSDDPLPTGSEEDCGLIGKRDIPIVIPKDLDAAILSSIKSKGPRVIKVERNPSGGKKPSDFDFNFPKTYKGRQ